MGRHVVFSSLFLLLAVCACQGFEASGNVTYSAWCHRWTVAGTVTVSKKELNTYDSKVIIQTASDDWDTHGVYTSSEVCVVDLTEAPSTCGPSAGDACHVISRSRDVYTISVNRPMHTSLNGVAVQAVLQANETSSRTWVMSTFGHLPESSDAPGAPSFTYQLDNGQTKNFGDASTVDVTACSDTFLQVKVCVESPRDKSILKMNSNDQLITSQPPCVETTVRYNFSSSVDNEIVVEYEDTMCSNRRQVTMQVVEGTASVCNVEDKPAPSSCSDPSLSKPREIITVMEPPMGVMCDTVSDGGGWVVFQRRVSDSDFYLGWDTYRKGFGDLSKNFWLGLDNIQSFCNAATKCELRVDYINEGDSDTDYAMYKDFYLGTEKEKFQLHIGSFSGNGTDLLKSLNLMSFSTKDRDNDNLPNKNCATDSYVTGAWWYDDYCLTSNLNGNWGGTNSVTYGSTVIMSEMKLRVIE